MKFKTRHPSTANRYAWVGEQENYLFPDTDFRAARARLRRVFDGLSRPADCLPLPIFSALGLAAVPHRDDPLKAFWRDAALLQPLGEPRELGEGLLRRLVFGEYGGVVETSRTVDAGLHDEKSLRHRVTSPVTPAASLV